MKLKQQPQDFRVEELTDAGAVESGEFAFYRLDKTGWTTPDALAAIRRRWQIDFRRLSYGGLKDRHAVTSQYFTILRGPQRNLAHERISVVYLGRRAEPFTSADVRANRFTIVLRGMNGAAASRARDAIGVLESTGVPNYFDDQRFGSVGDPPEFVAKEMVFGRFDRALWLALAAPYEHDRSDARREKELLRAKWGDWTALRAELPRGHARSLVDYLVHHPADFKGAVARLKPELQGLYLSAYQSYLWNRMLASWLMTEFGEENLSFVELKLGRMPVVRRVPEARRPAWENLALPLLSARVKPPPDAPWLTIAGQVLAAEGLTLSTLRIKGMQKPFFARGERPACIRPAQMRHESAADELNAGKTRLTMSFELQRGCYATMIVKRVTSC